MPIIKPIPEFLNNMPKWTDCKGQAIGCEEKLKVLKEGMLEVFQVAQEVYEDGILLGANPVELKQFMLKIIQELSNPYKD